MQMTPKLRLSALIFLAGWLLIGGLMTVPASAQSLARRSQVPVTDVLVLEWGFAQTNRFVVTADSIRVDFNMGTDTGDARTHFARALTRAERDRLLASLNRLYLSRLRPSYEGHSDLEHGYSYDFSIRKGKHLKESRLTNYSLAPLLAFTHRLNALLPPSFRISSGQQ
jgi:hypothetical protein